MDQFSIDNLLQRAASPTPPFFKRLQTIGIILATIGTAIATAPVALPVALVSAAGYITLAGTVATAVSQLAIGQE